MPRSVYDEIRSRLFVFERGIVLGPVFIGPERDGGRELEADSRGNLGSAGEGGVCVAVFWVGGSLLELEDGHVSDRNAVKWEPA